MKLIAICSLLLCLINFSAAARAAVAVDGTVVSAESANSSSDVYIKDIHGPVEELEFRQGTTAAHVYMDAISDPYFFFAFPAGNSGVGAWFKNPSKAATFASQSTPHRIDRAGGLHGVEVELSTLADQLVVNDFVLGSMRFIRDRELSVKTPEVVVEGTHVVVADRLIRVSRKSLNGLADYVLEIEALGDTHFSQTPNGIQMSSAAGLHLKVRGFTSEQPLTPLAPQDIFKAEALAKMKPEQVRAFSFLLYKEKLLAGSPRYQSRFGRDSNITLNVLLDAMKPEAVEMILAGALGGSHPTAGWVSHEQTEGDYAAFERMQNQQPYVGVGAGIEDYKMIDDDFIFAINLASYLIAYPDRAKAFLDRTDARHFSFRQLVQNNFSYVTRVTKHFVEHPTFQNLIRLKPGETVGQWRDSGNGLGGGVYPFDVNAALVPGALLALTNLYAFKESEFFDLKKSAEFEKAFQVWSTKAIPLFKVKIANKIAQARVQTYFQDLKMDPQYLPKAPAGDIIFPALSLDADGQPIAIMHSDDTMMMAFGAPSVRYLEGVVERVSREFPYGLHTPVGMVVANASFAGRDLQSKFSEFKYHGRTTWGMQEDLFVIGFERQIRRISLVPGLRPELRIKLDQQLTEARETVLKAINAKSSMSGAEVFSIAFKDGKFSAIPFNGDAKSNLNQLWSHLRIADPE